MQEPKRWMNFVKSAVVGAALIGFVGCDQPVGPTPQGVDALGSDGMGAAVTSLWMPGDAGLELVGAVGGQDGLGSKGPLTVAEAWSLVTLSVPEVETIRESIENRGVLGLTNLPTNEESPADAVGGGTQLRRYRFENSEDQVPFNTITQRLDDGREMRVVFSTRPSESGRPPSAMLTYIDGVAVSLHQFTYQWRKRQWEPLSVQTTTFEADGNVTAVVRTDLRERTGRRLSAAWLLDGMRAGFSRVTCELKKVFGATELYAEQRSGACWAEQTLLAAAVATEVYAIALVKAAVAACGITLGLTCPTVLNAVLALAVATALVTFAKLNYDRCIARLEDDGSDRGRLGGSDDDGDDGVSCITVIVEVSNDGGVNWRFLAYATLCE